MVSLCSTPVVRVSSPRDSGACFSLHADDWKVYYEAYYGKC